MTAEVVVIVPVLGRPHHARSFMESFRANTPENRARVLPVVSRDDPVDRVTWRATMDAWQDEGAPPVAMRKGWGFSFAEKVNAAYGFTREPWLLLVGSDVEFKPRWLESALITAQLTNAKLIATNDGGLTHSSNGGIATHPLINRQWIDQHGSCWDGPGVVTHSGYGHWSQDSEWSQVAQDAGVYAYSPLSVIVHHHPVFDASVPDDDVYRLGQSTAAADRALFMERLAKYGGQA